MQRATAPVFEIISRRSSCLGAPSVSTSADASPGVVEKETTGYDPFETELIVQGSAGFGSLDISRCV